MIEVNKVFLAGRLTQDPELRYTPSGVPVTTLRMAVNTTFFAKEGEKREEVCYINVSVWQKQAERCVEYLSKGRPVFVEGRLQSRQWEAEGGQKRTIIEVTANRVQFMDWSGEREEAPSRGAASPPPPEPLPGEEKPDDIPF
ncbi:MAG: single-stranded DNA-binding protein [Candidatus Hydrogenedentota bacterium]|nr:MAG: single-stranded DNA-binding protein [Candidatus Hydrogenedentota bacterium]